MRRRSIIDNGQGFEVSRALARAAQRGRFGLVGIGERISMLGGTFEIDSVPGGPTTIRFTLPRWDGSRAHRRYGPDSHGLPGRTDV